MGVEMLLECFGTVLDVSGDLGSDDALESMCEAIVYSYREAFGNAGNKKKVHNNILFLQRETNIYLRSCTPPSSRPISHPGFVQSHHHLICLHS